MTGQTQPLNSILDCLQKPIRYAAGANFANIMKVRGLSTLVSQQVENALARDLPKNEKGSWIALRNLFDDYDSLPRQGRQDRIKEAGVILDRISGFRLGRVTEPMGEIREHDGEESTARRSTPGSSVAWDTPVQYLKGVGPKRAETFLRLGIRTLEDLIYFMPWRYEDRSRLKPIAELRPGEEQTICGVVQSTHLKVTSRRRFKIFEMVVGDDSGSIRVKWFNQPYLQKTFKNGQSLMLTGKVKFNRYQGYGLEFENPVFELVSRSGKDDPASENLHTGRIVPIYHETYGGTSRMVRSLMKVVLDRYGAGLPEILPSAMREAHGLLDLSEALARVHFPASDISLDLLNQGRSDAHRRLVFDEFLLLQLGLGLKRKEVSEEPKGMAFRIDGPLLKGFLADLPYELTGGQKTVLEEIKRDMSRSYPMNRLLQGDVGCGKTVVALASMMIAADNGFQAALMAPTEILAEQHFLTIREWIRPYGLKCWLLRSGRPKRELKQTLEAIASGEPSFVIGTHALIQDEVCFGRLGLVVVDEQHKFGVMQRATLRRKGYHPDVLVMTATPIPRTLALTVYGDLDLSVINELPKGRVPIKTLLFSESKRSRMYAFLAEQIALGRQAYIVYPLVDESDKIDLKAAVKMAGHLERDVFPNLKIGLLHGQMPADEKEKVMKDFRDHRIQILVSTTVIEVGIDVPNATVTVIEHAERFGLSQLHQLRGRVGRGTHQSHCLLMAGAPVSGEALRRMKTMVRSNDGFVIAEEDLAIRGPGEFFGTRQSGIPELRVANILRDSMLLEEARAEAWRILEGDPRLSASQHAPMKAALIRKWSDNLELFTIS